MYRISPRFRQVGVDWQFSMHVDTSAGDPTVPGAAVNAAVEANLLSVLGVDCQYLGCQVSDPHGKVIAGQLVPSETQPFGSEGAVCLPQVACYHVILYDGIYGLGRTGGWFISGIPQDAYEGGTLFDAYRDLAKAAFDAYMADVNSGAGQINIWSPKDNVGYPVFRLAVNNIIREQRRREFGRSIGAHPSAH